MLATIVALYETNRDAQEAVDALERVGYPRADIQIAYSPDDPRNAPQPAQSGWGWLTECLNPPDVNDGMSCFGRLTQEQCVVSIRTNDEGVPGAIDILHKHGSSDINGPSIHLHHSGTPSRAVAPADRR